MTSKGKKTFKVNVDKHIVGLLNLLQEKEKFQLVVEHDDDMVKDQAQVEIATDCNKEKVIIKANANIWNTAMGCTHFD